MTTYPGSINGNNQSAQPQIHPSGPAFNNDLTPQNPIGGKILWNNQVWRYVRHKAGTGTVTPVSGGPAYAKTLTPGATATAVPVFDVTADQSDSVGGLQPVGVYGPFTTAPTADYYIWIAVGGVINCVVTGAVAGEKVIGSATDNTFDRISGVGTQTYPLVGTSMGASSGGLSPVLLRGMDW